MKIAYFSPLPPQRTGIADYSQELLPALVKAGAEVDLWVDQPAGSGLPDCAIRNYAGDPGLCAGLSRYDAVIYHMGNSPAHRNIYQTLLEFPGVVVLHDFVLHHFFASYFLEALRSPALYIEEMAYNYGAAGKELARSSLHGEQQIWEREPVRYPLNQRVLDHARGVIVHSDFARVLVHQSHPHLPVTKINLPVAIAKSAPPAELKKRYGIPEGRTVIASIGFGSSAKRIEIVLGALAAMRRDDILYLLVGEVGEAFRAELRRRGLSDLVRSTGYVEWQTFNDYCDLIDLGIDLRYPTMGESSASICRLLGKGKPCVVSDLGWFAELPGDCAVKLDVAADEPTLTRILSALIDDAPRRRAIGENARRYVREHHSPESAAAQYLDFLTRVRIVDSRRLVERSLIEGAGRALAQIGVREDHSTLIGGIAAEIAALFEPEKGGM
jgi:glycosyltransferase involved in cell wall biosynthesis